MLDEASRPKTAAYMRKTSDELQRAVMRAMHAVRIKSTEEA